MKTAVVLGLYGLVNVEAMTGELKAFKESMFMKAKEEGILGKKRNSVRNSPVLCENNVVTVNGEDFPCDNVDFLSYVSLSDIEIDNPQGHQPSGQAGSDIWGWLSPTGREFTLMMQDNGMSIFDTTDPYDPCHVAQLPSARRPQAWGDVKVYKDTAYIVKDARGGINNGDFANETNIGGEVLDLLRVDAISCDDRSNLPIYLENDFLWEFHGSAHNLAINTETGYLYSMGMDICSGGLIVIDLNKDRLRPEFVTCIDGDGYTHDVQCVVYDGPDTRYTGREICFAFNEEHVTIWDVTHKFSPSMLSRTGYPSQVYCHQGWLNGDMTLLFVDDELNEMCADNINATPSCSFAQNGINDVTKTSTVVFDVTDLTAPVVQGAFLHAEDSIDHNLYHWGSIHRKGWGGNDPIEYPPDERFIYLNNYVAGLKVLDVSSKRVENFEVAGYFDVAPDIDGLQFLGAWSGYMHPSGVYAISSIDRGLFLLKPRMAFEQTVQNPLALPTKAPSTDDDTDGSANDGESQASAILYLVTILLLSTIIVLLVTLLTQQKKTSVVAKNSKQTFEVKAEL